MFYLIAYDIPNDQRRTKVAKTLEDFGDRVQYSVFEYGAGPARAARRDAGSSEERDRSSGRQRSDLFPVPGLPDENLDSWARAGLRGSKCVHRRRTELTSVAEKSLGG